MSWICKNCSHSNLDEDTVCIVCDTPRDDRVESLEDNSHIEERERNRSEYSGSLREESETSFAETHRDDIISHSEIVRRDYSRVSRKGILSKVFPILILLCSFIVGQVIEYYTYVKYGYVFILTEFLEATATYDFNCLTLLLITTIVGALSGGLYINLICYFADKRKYINHWIISIAFAILIGVNPALGAPFAVIVAIILTIFRAKHGTKILAILLAVISVASLVVVVPVAMTLPAIYVVTIDYQDGSESTEQIRVTIGDEMPDLDEPSRIGYTFLGIFDEQVGGTQYYDAGMNNVKNWDVDGNTTLYAQWSANAYTITFDKRGGILGTNNVEAIYDSVMPDAEPPVRTGYTFEGYYDSIYGGEQYYNASMQGIGHWDIAENITLYAYWSANTYSITFDKQGGTGGTDSVLATFDMAMPNAEAPLRDGYTFLGYFDDINDGTQYYDSSMQSMINWDQPSDTTLYAQWAVNSYIVTFDKQSGTGGTDSVVATYDMEMPDAEAPVRTGYSFEGYFDSVVGGTQYYDFSMQSLVNWNKTADSVLYAHWSANTYSIILDLQGGTGGTSRVTATYGQRMPSAIMPTKAGYDFNGFYTGLNGAGTQYYSSNMSSSRSWNIASDTILYAYWTVSDITASASPSSLTDIDSSKTTTINVSGGSGSYSYAVTNNPSGVSWSFNGNILTLRKTGDSASGSVTIRVTDNVTNATDTCAVRYTTTGGCVATGTLITLSDGSQVPVERLTGDEMLLVWNMYTGDFDSAPILFIDQDDSKEYEVINLKFSDGTEVKVITEHAFWDFNLNEYVFLDKNASQYIGHWFNKQTGTGTDFAWTKVQLVSVTIYKEYSIAWSPVTYGHLCYYVNGMLSMPGNTEGLINIFDVNSEQMAYDADQMREDIELYGLYTYDEFNSVMPVSEVLFNAFNGQYLKVAIGKGIIDWERIKDLISRYDIG